MMTDTSPLLDPMMSFTARANGATFVAEVPSNKYRYVQVLDLDTDRPRVVLWNRSDRLDAYQVQMVRA